MPKPLSLTELNGLAAAAEAMITREPRMRCIFNETATPEEQTAVRDLKKAATSAYVAGATADSNRSSTLHMRHYAKLLIRQADHMAAVILRKSPMYQIKMSICFNTRAENMPYADYLDQLGACTLAAAARIGR